MAHVERRLDDGTYLFGFRRRTRATQASITTAMPAPKRALKNRSDSPEGVHDPIGNVEE